MIHPTKLVAMRGEVQTELSLLELRHLAYLIEHRNRVVSAKELYDAIWMGRALEHGNIVNVYVKGLRSKLGKEAILTVRGEGFRLMA